MASVPKYSYETREGVRAGSGTPNYSAPNGSVAEFNLNVEVYVHAGSTCALNAGIGEVYLRRARVSFPDVYSKHVILSSSVLF